MKTKLYVFDYDGTLMQSPEPIEGMALYQEKVGSKYPHKGWWSKPESLHPMFDIQPNQTVLDHYKIAMSDENAHVIMMTNRLKRLAEHMQVHLDRHGILFEHKFYGDSTDGRQTKPERLVTVINTLQSDGHKIDNVIVLDDMEEQIGYYIKMRQDLLGEIQVQILQVQNGTIIER